MHDLIPFFLVLCAGVFFAELFRRAHFPWVITLILGGVIIGPYGLDVFETNSTITLIGEIGLIFLMFMAGSETKLKGLSDMKWTVFSLTLANTTIPLLTGISVGLWLGYPMMTSFLIGITFIASSVAVIIPSLEIMGIMNARLTKAVILSTVLEDTVSLILLSFVLQKVSPVTHLPLPLFYLFLFLILIVFRWGLPKIFYFFSLARRGVSDLFQQELQTVFALLLGVVVSFELLGLHSVIAGFFTGLVLANSLNNKMVHERLRAIGYGVFIPTFFVILGAQLDLSIFVEGSHLYYSMGILFLSALVSNFGSGWLGGRMGGLSDKESVFAGAATIPLLTTTLAVVFVGIDLNIIDHTLGTILLTVSVATTFVTPLALKVAFSHLTSRKKSLMYKKTA